MKLLVCFGVALIVALALLISVKTEDPSSEGNDSIQRSNLPVSNEAQLHDIGYGGDGMVAWSSDTEIQEYFLEQGTDVTLADRRFDGVDWVRTESTHSTSYEVTAMAPRGKDELFLAGTATSGEVVVEKWKFKKVAKPGGILVKIPIRTELYRGSGLAEIRQLAVDPESRFSLLLSGQGSASILYRLPLVASAVPVVEYTHSPGLPIGDMLYISRYEHLSLGRVWQLSKEPVMDPIGNLVDDTVILLIDAQNDGVFEDETVGSTLALYGAGVLRADMIANDFSG